MIKRFVQRHGRMATRGWSAQAPTFSTGASQGPTSSGDLRRDLLEASLKQVPNFGWTGDSIAAAAVEMKLSPTVHGLFERGAIELVDFQMNQSNADLEDFLKRYCETVIENETEDARAERIIAAGIQHRLKSVIPVIRSWPQAMAMGASPENASETMAHLAKIGELIGYYADGETNGKWYNARTAICLVYTNSELYMLCDYSEDYKDTWDFVSKHVRDVRSTGESTQDVFNVLNAVAGGIHHAASGLKSAFGPALSDLPLPHLGNVVSNASKTVNSVRDATYSAVAQTGAPGAVDAVKSLDKMVNPMYNEPATVSTSAAADEPASDTSSSDESAILPVSLPTGMSLFGLLSMDATEAAELIRQHNPDFEVVLCKVDEHYEPLAKANVVRLVLGKHNLVVDILRK